MSHSRYILGLFAFAVLLPAPAFADGPQAIATTIQHLGLAANSGDIDTVHRHLHHALNCLVGPNGDGFDAAPGNPCAEAGGAIPQTSDAELRAKLETAATEVRGGITDMDVAEAKQVATDVQAMLR